MWNQSSFVFPVHIVKWNISAATGTATLFTGGATSAATFLVAVATAPAPLLFFITSDKRQRRCFLAEKAAALQHFFLSKYSAAAATANQLLPTLFRLTFSHVTVWSLYSQLVFTRPLLPHYSSLVEHTRLPL